MKKRLPKGISNYEDLIKQGYYFVDKTEYIKKIESLSDKVLMFVRPRKFGKTLFTSVLENYYDKLKTDKFEQLFGETYIGKNPTENRNKYCILKFNFSGIDTTNVETTINGFKNEVASSVDYFVKKYNLDYNVNYELTAESILDTLFKAFDIQRSNEKIYVIIDEYDHFANELLGFDFDNFKNLVTKNGKVRKWYEILKKGTEKVVDRIFMTGVAPITLDGMTSGFNISKDITRDVRFNEMMGFTENQIIDLMDSQEIEKEKQNILLPIMKENYDGYKFMLNGKEFLYNSNMSLNFLTDYIGLGVMPESFIDTNIASDYKKLSNMLNTCSAENRVDIIEKTISGEGLVSNITEKFNPEIGFGEKELISMLYYLGYLTVKGENLGLPFLQIPNFVMKELYADYFLEILQKETQIVPDKGLIDILRDLAINGKVDKIVERLEEYLRHLSNRDFAKFDEKYVKVLFFSIAMNMKNIYFVKSEPEYERKYPDILMIPKKEEKGYKAILIEFKYLKRGEEEKLEEKQKQAREQVKEYSEIEEIKKLKNLKKFAIVAVVDKAYIEEIE